MVWHADDGNATSHANFWRMKKKEMDATPCLVQAQYATLAIGTLHRNRTAGSKCDSVSAYYTRTWPKSEHKQFFNVIHQNQLRKI